MTCNCGRGGNLPCGCCEGVELLTPAAIGNRPGLDAINYRVGTHGTFLETMKARLSGNQLWSLAGLKTRDSSDASIALLDGWATIADVLSFYQERIANEGYLGTATERRSILELARLVGYALRPGVSASAYLAYTLDKPVAIPPLLDKPAPEPEDPLVTIPDGSRSQSVPGPGELPQSFETSEDLVARSAWNNLQVRLTRPQRIDGDTRVIYLKGLPNLKPGDPLLIIASPAVVYRVETVTADPANDRTRVTFKPWSEAGAALGLVARVAETVNRFSAAERFGVVPTSRSGRAVLAQLEQLQKLAAAGAPAEEMKSTLVDEVLPKLREVHQAAIVGRFTRVQPWVRDLVDALEGALQGRSAGEIKTALPDVQSASTIDLTAVLPALARPRSVPPQDSTELPRSVSTSLGNTTDAVPKLLGSLVPGVENVLYKAWKNVPVTAAPASEAHLFRVRASVFGHNAPLEPTRNTAGVITGTKEWDLLKPVSPPTTETFEIIVGEKQGTGPASERTVVTEIHLGDKSTDSVALQNQQETKIKFKAINDVIMVKLDRSTAPAPPPSVVIMPPVTTAPLTPTTTLVFTFTNRPIMFKLEIPLTGKAFATLLKIDAAVKLTQPVKDDNSGDLTTKVDLQIPGVIQNREEPRFLWLDAPYEQIVPGSWIVLEKPGTVIDTSTGLPADSTLVITKALAVSERSRAEYGISLKSMRLRLGHDWIDPTRGKDTFETVRGTAVFAGSERLELAEEPIEKAIAGNELELDGLYDGLEAGRWLILCGERTDVVNSPPLKRIGAAADAAPEVHVEGVPATELVMLAGVEQRFDPELRGDKTHTYLRLFGNLAYKYKRDTLIVYGNVVNSTNGETRNEVLGRGDASKSLQTFTLKQSPLTFVAASNPDGVETTLKVRVNDVLWHEADDLSSLGPNDYGYIMRTDDEDKTSVIFGTGEHGARLPTSPDNVSAVYRNGIGKAGNVKADQISLLSTRPLGVKGVTNPMPASGGADRESRDQARRNAPLAVMALDRLVSTRDYADFARTFAGIAKASAERLSDGQRRLVHLTIAGQDDIPIETTSDLYRNLGKALRNFGDPHQPIQIALRRLLLLVLEARVRVLPDYLFEKVEPKIRAALLDRFSFERRELGQDALLSDAMSTIQHVEGVAYVDMDKFDWIDETKVIEHLSGGPSLGDSVMRKERISVALALIDANEIDAAKRIKPAEIAYLSPSVPDTIILTEISS